MFKNVFLSAVAVSLLSVSPLFAEQVHSTWIGGSGDWAWSSMWDPAIVPDNSRPQTFAVTIDGSGGSVHIQVYDSFTVDSIATYGKVDIKNWATRPIWGLTALNGLTNYGDRLHLDVSILGDVTNESNGKLEISEHINIYGDLINSLDAEITVYRQDIDVEGDGDGGKVINNGLIRCQSNGGIGEQSLFENSGKIELYQGTCNGAEFINRSSGVISGSGVLSADTLFQNNGVIYCPVSSLISAVRRGPFINNGSVISYSGSSMGVLTPSDANNFGAIEINAGATFACSTDIINETDSILLLKGGTLRAENFIQKPGATFQGQGDISGNIAIDPNGLVRLTGPTNIFGDVQIGPNATLEISDGRTLIKGRCTCDRGTIHLKGGWIIPQGGLIDNDCNIIREPGLYNDAADLNLDGKVDFADSASFADTWLSQTPL